MTFTVHQLLKIMFAYDTAGLNSNNKLPHLISHVNAELKKIACLFHTIKIAVNASKTKLIIIHTRGKPVDNNLTNFFRMTVIILNLYVY